MIVGAVTGMIWFWIPASLLIIAVTSIPSVIGTVLGGVVFVYAVRATDPESPSRGPEFQLQPP